MLSRDLANSVTVARRFIKQQWAAAMIQLIDMCPDPWRDVLGEVILSDAGRDLETFLNSEIAAGATVYPPLNRVFACLSDAVLDNVRVVVLGQDPYHRPNQATGRAFEVPRSARPPPSLMNIAKLLSKDLGATCDPLASIARWPEQGVMLLNTVLTVRAGEPESHKRKGWELITDRIIECVAATSTYTVFLLWGAHAQTKAALVQGEQNLVLVAPHPSPLSAHRGFFDCRHFSHVNAWLMERGEEPIDWVVA